MHRYVPYWGKGSIVVVAHITSNIKVKLTCTLQLMLPLRAESYNVVQGHAKVRVPRCSGSTIQATGYHVARNAFKKGSDNILPYTGVIFERAFELQASVLHQSEQYTRCGGKRYAQYQGQAR